MAIVVFPGTFDPITNGHVDVAVRAAHLFDEVIIAIYDDGEGGRKQPLFPVAVRVALATESVADKPNIRVDSFHGLVVDYANRVGAHAIVRGLRAVSDFEYELGMAHVNSSLNSAIETVCVMTSSSHSYIRSSLVREVALLGGDVSALVPPHVYRALRAKIPRE